MKESGLCASTHGGIFYYLGLELYHNEGILCASCLICHRQFRLFDV